MNPNTFLTKSTGPNDPQRIIRPGLPSDLPYLCDLQNRLHESIGYTPRGGLQDRIETNRLIVVQENDLPAGYVNFTHRRDGHTHISQLAVDPAIWRTQAGTRLMQIILDGARRARSQYVTLRTAIDLPANDFWPTVGFEDDGCQQGQRRMLACWRHPLYAEGNSLVASHGYI